MSHGWGSSAMVAMQETLLGVSIVEPGPDGTVRLSVAPPASGLRRATGSVPAVAGPASVSWQRRGAGVALTLDVPANASALVQLPTTDPARDARGACRRRRRRGWRCARRPAGAPYFESGRHLPVHDVMTRGGPPTRCTWRGRAA